MVCWTRRWLVLMMGAAVAGVMTVSDVRAHAILQKSEPAQGATVTIPPKQVTLSFNERVDLAVSIVQVTGPAGKVDVGKLQAVEPRTLVAPLAGTLVDGAYKVAWQTAGDDGHVEKGVVAFVLKRAN
jgi:methionine-rich copper-binding protein CopC